MKQTAVEWLEEKIKLSLGDEFQYLVGFFTLASEMEKEQIVKAVYDSMGTNFDPNMGRAEQYYKEKYGK